MATLAGNVLQRTRCGYFRDTSYHACNKRDPGTGCSAMEGCNRRLAVLGTSEACIANYPGDLAVALVALEAEVNLLAWTGGNGRSRSSSCTASPRHATHRDRPCTGRAHHRLQGARRAWTRRSRYVKVRDRASYDFALASAAVALDLEGDTVRAARIGLGGLVAKPWRARDAEAVLLGRRLDETTAREAAEAALAGASPCGEASFQDRARPPHAGARAARNTGDGATAMTSLIGQPHTRIDGPAKVTGRALYPSDEALRNPAWAFLLTSAIARGRIARFDLDEARAMPGVIDILTHEVSAARITRRASNRAARPRPRWRTTASARWPDHRHRAGRHLRDRARRRIRVRVHYAREDAVGDLWLAGRRGVGARRWRAP